MLNTQTVGPGSRPSRWLMLLASPVTEPITAQKPDADKAPLSSYEPDRTGAAWGRRRFQGRAGQGQGGQSIRSWRARPSFFSKERRYGPSTARGPDAKLKDDRAGKPIQGRARLRGLPEGMNLQKTLAAMSRAMRSATRDCSPRATCRLPHPKARTSGGMVFPADGDQATPPPAALQILRFRFARTVPHRIPRRRSS